MRNPHSAWAPRRWRCATPFESVLQFGKPPVAPDNSRPKGEQRTPKCLPRVAVRWWLFTTWAPCSPPRTDLIDQAGFHVAAVQPPAAEHATIKHQQRAPGSKFRRTTWPRSCASHRRRSTGHHRQIGRYTGRKTRCSVASSGWRDSGWKSGGVSLSRAEGSSAHPSMIRRHRQIAKARHACRCRPNPVLM
jgi:hypothetical protein